VELFEEIRRKYAFGIGAIASAAKKLEVHRRMERETISTNTEVRPAIASRHGRDSVPRHSGRNQCVEARRS